MTPEQAALGKEIDARLKKAMENGDPACEEAQTACALHKEWLLMSWARAMYSPETEMQLVESYETNDKLRAYYDQAVAPGAAAFFVKAMKIYLKDELLDE